MTETKSPSPRGESPYRTTPLRSKKKRHSGNTAIICPLMEHNESIFSAEWKDDWKLVKSLKLGGAPTCLSLDDPLKTLGCAAVFAFIRDSLNIHPLCCMYMQLQLINEALGANPNSPSYRPSGRAGTKNRCAECLGKGLRCLHSLCSHSSLGSPRVWPHGDQVP